MVPEKWISLSLASILLIVSFVRLPYSFRMAEYDVAVFSWLVSLYFCINALSFQAVFVSKAICITAEKEPQEYVFK